MSHTGILPSALNYRSYLCLLDRDSPDITIRSTQIKEFDKPGNDYEKKGALGAVYILLQPGHFDILYPRQKVGEEQLSELMAHLHKRCLERESCGNSGGCTGNSPRSNAMHSLSKEISDGDEDRLSNVEGVMALNKSSIDITPKFREIAVEREVKH